MLSFPWLKADAELTWATAPGGAKRVRVLFIGSEAVLTRLEGETFTDFDPGLIPKRNNWINPHEFEESGRCQSPRPGPSRRFCYQQPSELENHNVERC